eukprot:1684341-Heterocapsa_arctica.AAC.1
MATAAGGTRGTPNAVHNFHRAVAQGLPTVVVPNFHRVVAPWLPTVVVFTTSTLLLYKARGLLRRW